MVAVITDEGAVGRGMRMQRRTRREKNARERRDELIE